jgi:uncharacterized protein YdgA (DUF945 family)
MSEGAIKYGDIQVNITDLDGSAMNIMATIGNALKRHGVSEDEISQYYAESTSSDYDNLLVTAAKWVRVS